MRNTISSDGLGGFLGVSQSLKLGAEKRLRYKFHFFLILFFLIWFHNMHVYESSCLSITLSMQYNNEIYKHIKLCQHYGRRITSPTRNIRFTKACVRILFIACFLSWLYSLLLLSGDIHPNPGPASLSTATENISSSSFTHELLSNHLSIFHLNVQSLLPKIDLIRAESELYDIAVFSESWLKPNIIDDEILTSFQD